MVLIKLGQLFTNYVPKDSVRMLCSLSMTKNSKSVAPQRLLCSCCISTAATVAAAPRRPVPRGALALAAPAAKGPGIPWALRAPPAPPEQHGYGHGHRENKQNHLPPLMVNSSQRQHAAKDRRRRRIRRRRRRRRKRRRRRRNCSVSVECRVFCHGHVPSHPR